MEAPNRHPALWHKAKARTKFQNHALVYGLVNGGLWLLFFLTPHPMHELPWPIWTSGFWGIGLALQGAAAYTGLAAGQRTQREYERLLRAQEGQ